MIGNINWAKEIKEILNTSRFIYIKYLDKRDDNND